MEKVLGEDLVEDILLRLPPDDPVSLLRAATVCRRWCRIISAPDFRRRFGQRHRTAPMLGFLANLRDGDEDDRFDYAARFVPATPFLPRGSEHRDLDSRHGRVLLTSMPWGPKLEIWDPVTDELREIPDLTLSSPFTWNAGVVCADYAACECDHLDCRRGPFFLVVFLDADDAQMRVHLYSSEDGAWDFAVLMTTGDGGLGFARVEKSRLWICSMETDPMGDDFWVPVRSIELETLLSKLMHTPL
ncbi:uncharacterized protein LOC8054441 [Sorghum bicolor]|jgi:hypothetical protein|uniref:F-box domain-containing protein n=1 Tax=Sorghum bicolor TaxID=4558 RepID=A0A1B6QA89_SORBI|nr:uncharacterized protein LOC8054441 [Sorghum bicolor]KXG34824.1 hypothetical protein SORBI_3002G096800 [Sorghum bicolor]|eukprot:XP_002461782.2 uncharacterized protein LOC8054441 [Sorghum bicolor]